MIQKFINEYKNENWHLIFQRAKTKIAEIDLVFENEFEIRLIEVKTLDQAWRAFQRISPRQVEKLLLNQLYLSRIFTTKTFKSQVCWVLKNDLHFVDLGD